MATWPLFLALSMIAAFVMQGAPALASERTDEEVLEAIWRSPGDSPVFFSDRFLNEIPPDRLMTIFADLVDRCGPFSSVEKGGPEGTFTLITERCEIPADIVRNDQGTIDGLFFHEPARRDASLDDLLAEIASFDGAVSYALVENGEMIAGHDADRPMAVASAFKLIVLQALADLIDEGEAAWADVVTLEERHISLPSGLLQDMPVGSPFTLHTLAAAMISQSDNTATDLLIDVVGRDRLEGLSGLVPFLTTREFFQLKADDAAYRRFQAGDLPERRALLEELAGGLLPSEQDVSKPWQPEAEWLLSTRDLCGRIGGLATIDLMQIATGPIHTDGWQQVAYKGGSEIGVLNFTTLARDADGRAFCFSVTWNADQDIDDAGLAGLYASVFHALKTRD